MLMRKFWPLLIAGSVGAMSVQAAPADTHELLVGSTPIKLDLPPTPVLSDIDRAAADWAQQHGQPTGRHTDTLAGAAHWFLPLRGDRGSLGVLGLRFDDEARLRLDDGELRDDVQAQCKALWPQITTENLFALTDYAGYKHEFLKLFGFERSDVDYDAEVDPVALQVSPGNEAHLHGFATEAIGADGQGRRMYLHTSPEFAMKKLLAAGETRIAAFAHVWRNRERGPLHSPEFTMLEWYRVAEDYAVLMQDTVAFLRLAARTTGAGPPSFAAVSARLPSLVR